jgi:hypothetical protein
MRQLIRRLRGVIGTGLTWALGWAGFSAVVGAIFGAFSIPRLALVGGAMGFIAGGAFGLILSITERRRRLEDLSLRRIALWGGLGGVLVAGSFNLFGGSGGLIWDFVATMAFLGAASSAGTVAVVRRGDPKLIEGEDDPPLLPEGG